MKKALCMIMVLAVSLTLLSGCNKPKAQTNGGSRGSRGMQGQFQRADLIGEVTQISGNNVTLKVAEMPARDNGGGQNNNSGGQDNNGGNRNRGQNQERSNSNQNGGGFQRQFNFTGETKTVTIPDGVEISSFGFGRGQNDPNTEKKTLKDIKSGDILQIWYSDKDKSTVSRISIMGTQQNNSQQNNTSQSS